MAKNEERDGTKHAVDAEKQRLDQPLHHCSARALHTSNAGNTIIDEGRGAVDVSVMAVSLVEQLSG
jgi:hypothetical protein